MCPTDTCLAVEILHCLGCGETPAKEIPSIGCHSGGYGPAAILPVVRTAICGLSVEAHEVRISLARPHAAADFNCPLLIIPEWPDSHPVTGRAPKVDDVRGTILAG